MGKEFWFVFCCSMTSEFCIRLWNNCFLSFYSFNPDFVLFPCLGLFCVSLPQHTLLPGWENWECQLLLPGVLVLWFAAATVFRSELWRLPVRPKWFRLCPGGQLQNCYSAGVPCCQVIITTYVIYDANGSITSGFDAEVMMIF